MLCRFSCLRTPHVFGKNMKKKINTEILIDSVFGKRLDDLLSVEFLMFVRKRQEDLVSIILLFQA